MFGVRPDQVDKVITRPNKIYNFCILAHVDHGKTTLCDHLLASNSIISRDLAGEVRYMDCLPAERDRNITMKTSAVSLLYKHEQDLFYLTVVDSPGHVDFEAEVSNAVRLSDGCIILVDAIEGVCVQTELVLRVAFKERLSPILVINKVDRLFTERAMDPTSAEVHLEQLITDVNAATGQESTVFDPSLGNVIFASCVEKWGLTIPSIAAEWKDRLQKTVEQTSELFWGPHFYDTVKRTIVSKPPRPDSPTFFAQAVLTPLWKAHQDNVKPEQLAKPFGITELAPKETNFSLLAKWKPLSNSLLETVVKFMETPAQAQSIGLQQICPRITEFPVLDKASRECDLTAPVLAFAPKIVHGGLLRFPQRQFPFVAYLRVYSGTLQVGDSLFTKHERSPLTTQIKVANLFIFMGNELIEINRAPVGCVVGLALEEPLLKQTTLCSLPDFPLFTSVTHYAQPIINVSIEALDLTKQEALQKGAELLARIDPAITVSSEANGQLVLSAMGQVHLQFCIDELKTYMAKSIEFSVSEPLVPCRETLIGSADNIAATVIKTVVVASCHALPQEVLDIITQKENWKLPEIKAALEPIIDVTDIIDFYGGNLLFAGSQFASYHNSLAAGFKLCTSAGPLAEEPIFGAGFVVNEVHIRQLTLAYLLQQDDDTAFVPTVDANLDQSVMFGETIGASKEAFREAFKAASPRVMEPLYRCEIQADFSVIGKTYDVLQQHRCKITDEKQKEGSTSLFISCLLPVLESFTFADDLRSKASGKAHPQLMFSHFELVPDDPFWKPTTQEELEIYGKDGLELKPNIAKKILEVVKKRKGIWTENIEQKADVKSTLSKTK